MPQKNLAAHFQKFYSCRWLKCMQYDWFFFFCRATMTHAVTRLSSPAHCLPIQIGTTVVARRQLTLLPIIALAVLITVMSQLYRSERASPGARVITRRDRNAAPKCRNILTEKRGITKRVSATRWADPQIIFLFFYAKCHCRDPF